MICVLLFAMVIAALIAVLFLARSSAENNLLERISTTDVGYRVSFGEYNDHSKWIVLAVEEDRTLLLSENCIKNMPLDESDENASWDDSSLYAWLNGAYYDTAFSDAEKSIISEEGVFLLSSEEIGKYFYTYKANWFSCIARDADGEKTEWWLRSKAEDGGNLFVNAAGYLSEYGINPSVSSGVRPAVWVNVLREPNSYIKEAKLHYIRYSDYIEPADDTSDDQWKIDYQMDSSDREIYINDSSMYETIFGFAKPTEQELCDAVDSNPDINEKYSAFFKGFIHDWLTMYPASDLSVLKHNLATLNVHEVREDGIELFMALSGGANACYYVDSNSIYIAETSDISNKQSQDYVIAVHETLHAARNAIIEQEDSTTIYISLNDFPHNTTGFGDCHDEALVSWFSYQLQNLGNKSHSYIYLSSMYRQFMPYLDYDGADYINHSAGRFIESMQAYFDECGIKYQALSVFKLMDDMIQSYDKTELPPYSTDYTALYESLSLLRQHQIGYADMDSQEKTAAFEVFWEDLTLFLNDESIEFYGITKEDYSPYWN